MQVQARPQAAQRPFQTLETAVPHIECALIPVPKGDKERFSATNARVAQIFLANGAVRILDFWGVDLPDGVVTDFKKAVKANDDETVVVSLIIWPDKATCDEGNAKLMADPNMPAPSEMPFDLKRMFFGGFEPLLDTDQG